MNQKYKYLLLLLLVLLPAILPAQKGKIKKTDAIICGKTDSALSVELIKYPAYLISLSGDDTLKFISTISNGSFSFHLPSIKQPTYVSIIFKKPNSHLNNIIGYLIEPGDSIYILHNTDRIYFSGKGSVKFTCQYQMEMAQPKRRIVENSEYLDMYRFLKTSAERTDSIATVKLAIVESFRDKLNPRVYQLIKVDCISEKFTYQYNPISYYMYKMRKDSALLTQIIRYYQEHYAGQAADTVNTTILIRSKNYSPYILSKARMDCEIRANMPVPLKKSFFTPWSDIYHEINDHYTGLLKERLLTGFFAWQKNLGDSIGIFLAATIYTAKDFYLKNILHDIQVKTKGVNAFPFSLPDTTGKLVTLADFKGRVIVMDFWYTGCGWCQVIARRVIKPQVALKDPRVAYVSVSTDTDKQMWKQSIASGNYTSIGEIDLNTGKMAYNQSIITHYRIEGFPYIIVIDTKGKIFAVNPVNTASTPEELQKVIEEALKEI